MVAANDRFGITPHGTGVLVVGVDALLELRELELDELHDDRLLDALEELEELEEELDDSEDPTVTESLLADTDFELEELELLELDELELLELEELDDDELLADELEALEEDELLELALELDELDDDVFVVADGRVLPPPAVVADVAITAATRRNANP